MMISLLAEFNSRVVHAFEQGRITRAKLDRYVSYYLTEPLVKEAYNLNHAAHSAPSQAQSNLLHHRLLQLQQHLVGVWDAIWAIDSAVGSLIAPVSSPSFFL